MNYPNLPMKIISYSSVASENKPPKFFSPYFPICSLLKTCCHHFHSFSPIEKENDERICHHTEGRPSLEASWPPTTWKGRSLASGRRKRGREIHEEIWEKPRKTPGKPWEIHGKSTMNGNFRGKFIERNGEMFLQALFDYQRVLWQCREFQNSRHRFPTKKQLTCAACF